MCLRDRRTAGQTRGYPRVRLKNPYIGDDVPEISRRVNYCFRRSRRRGVFPNVLSLFAPRAAGTRGVWKAAPLNNPPLSPLAALLKSVVARAGPPGDPRALEGVI